MTTTKRARSRMKFKCRTCTGVTPDKLGAYLIELIEDSYGSPEELAKHLDLAIEMLFYLEEDTFDQKDILVLYPQ